MSRLFVAIVPPPTVRSELAALAAEAEDLRMTPEQNFHLTLRYIGPVESGSEEQFIRALGRVAVESFILPVGEVGIFPSHGPAKVVWAGIGNGHTRLFQLRKQVDEALLSVDIMVDVHHFHPHFTLGRLAIDYETKLLAKFLGRHAGFEAPPFRVSEFQLMASETQPGRAPRYRSVQVFPLDGSRAA
jgi:2'-5' RNA ligase